MTSNRTCLAALALLALVIALPSRALAGVDEFRLKMEKWVETRQLLSEEKADWEVEQEYLQSTIDLFEQEKAALSAEVAELQETSTAADDERRDLLLERSEYQRSAAALEARIGEMEKGVQGLVPQLPRPLQKKLEPLLVQIPDDPDNSRVGLGQRLMNVLGVLAQTEKWNATATFAGETRPSADGQKVQVRTLYWGLAQAVYVDAAGRSAGIGRPTSDGWEFSDQLDLVDDAQLFMDIYEGNVDVIQFVEFPAEIN